MIVSILVIKSYKSSVEDAEGRTLSAAPPQPLCGSAVKTLMASLVGVTCVTRRGIRLELSAAAAKRPRSVSVKEARR